MLRSLHLESQTHELTNGSLTQAVYSPANRRLVQSDRELRPHWLAVTMADLNPKP